VWVLGAPWDCLSDEPGKFQVVCRPGISFGRRNLKRGGRGRGPKKIMQNKVDFAKISK
jgi:hypothetical protein